MNVAAWATLLLLLAVPASAGAVTARVPVAHGWEGEVRGQVPQIPATFYGAATVDGKAPPEGSEVRGIINGLDCTQPGAAGTISADGVGAYVISVMHESQRSGCGKDGATVNFTIAGRDAGQSATWAPGPQQLGLNAGIGQAQPLPSNVPVPTNAPETASAAASGVPPAGSVQSQATRGSTPLPPGTSDTTDSDGDGPGVAGVAIVALFVIALLAGAAGMIVSRRKAAPGPPRDGGTGEPT